MAFGMPLSWEDVHLGDPGKVRRDGRWRLFDASNGRIVNRPNESKG